MIAAIIENMTAKQSKIIGYTLNKSFKAGAKEGDKILRSITASTATMGFDMSKVADTHLNKITGDTIGRIGKYNSALTNQLQVQYNTLLADNRLVNSLKVIALAKGQTTTKKIVNILEMEGIRGGKNPRQVSKMLIPHVQRFFGPEGVLIDNVGKFKKVLKVDADGNFKYVKQAITRPYRATPKAYSNLLARSSMIQAHHEGRYQSLQKTGLVDHYISKSVLDANTCNLCATMHGQRVSHSEGPLYHPSGACDLKPIWKKDSGIPNKDPAFYENQRDQHFWKQHQLAEYNKNMPRGAKLKFHSMLPKDALVDMPGKDAMRTIRYNTLGKPAAITPKLLISKTKTVKRMIDKEIADDLWRETAKDGKEHGFMLNDKALKVIGDKDSISLDGFGKGVQYKAYHTHPGWDCPLSQQDVALLLRKEDKREISAITKKYIYTLSKTTDTPKIEGFGTYAKVYEKMQKQADAIFRAKQHTASNLKVLRKKSLVEAGKEIAKEYHLKYTIIKR
jgi:hypothetical protein